MLEMLVSLCLFWIFSYYFYNLMKQYFDASNIVLFLISCVLAVPALKLDTVVFMFELHFIAISAITRFITKRILKCEINLKKATLCIVPLPLIVSGMVVSYGRWNMDQIVRTEYNVTTDKPISKNLTVTMLADLHYPSATSKSELQTLVQRIKNEKSDIVILNGDIIDEHTTMHQRIELFQTLGELSKDSQVFYTFGNHDLGKHSLSNKIDDETLENMIESCGITVLRDDVIELDGNVTILGRDDYSLKTSNSVSALLSQTDKEKYLMVFDHQPRELDRLAEYGVDLHLSGHVHAGQIFPLYYLYEFLGINELNYGLEKREQMTAINTSGAAGWGFPVRTQKNSEYVVVNIKKA